jgi:hypothetical protein
MFDRISDSFSLATSSWRLLRQDKQLILFPILSGISCVLVMAAFLTPLAFFPELLNFDKDAQGNVQVPLWVYPVLFAYYFVNYFVVIFFNAALIGCAVLRFQGQPAGLKDGLMIASSRLPQIVEWALVSATVGLLLKMIESVHEKAGEIVSAILGTGWSIITYFVVPVLVVEKVGPFQAIQRSLALLRKSWGEALVGHLGLGFFLFLFLLPALLVGILGALMIAAAPPVGLLLVALAVLYFLVWLAVGPALNGIFLAALYQFASTGSVPNGFDQHVLANAFGSKK